MPSVTTARARMWTPNMRWFVEITPLGAKPGSVTPLCVEAPQWKHALQKARALRGDDAPLSNFSIDLLDDGYRAIDPIARLRYEVRRAPDNTPITTSAPQPAPAEPPAEPPKPAAEPAKKKADLTGTIAYESKGAALIAEQAKTEAVKAAEPKKADLSGTIAYESKGAAIIAEPAKTEAVKAPEPKKADLTGTIAYESKGAAIIAEPAKAEAVKAAEPAKPAEPAKKAEATKPVEPAKPAPAKSAPSLPPFKLLSSREEDPTESSPLTYREQVFAVEAGTPLDEARRLILDRLEQVRAGLDGARNGKLVNLAVFDHVFQGRPQRRPIVTLTWKDWKGSEPELQYPARDGHSIRPASPSLPPKSAPTPAAAAPAPAPASAKPSVPPPSAAPSGAPAAVPASTLNSAKPSVQPKPAPEPEVPVVAASAPQPAKAAEPAPKPVKVEPAPQPAKVEPAVVAVPVVAIGGPDSAAPTRPVPTVASPTTPAPIEAAVTEPPSKPAKSEPPPKPAAKSEPPPKAEPAKSEPPPKPAAKSEPPPKSEPAKSEPPPKPAAKSEPPPKPAPAKSEPPPKPAAKAEPAKAAAKTEPAKAKTEPAKAAAAPATVRAAAPKKRLTGDDLITELFEAFGDLHFLRDTLEGAEFVLHLTMEKLPSEVALVSFFDMNKREFVIARQAGGPRTALCKRQPERAPLAFQAMRKRHAIVISDKEGAQKAMDERFRAIGVEIKSMVVAPVELGGRFLGLIEIVNPLDGGAFREGDGNALTYIGQQFAEFVAERGVVVDDEHIRETKPAPPQARASAAPSSKKR